MKASCAGELEEALINLPGRARVISEIKAKFARGELCDHGFEEDVLLRLGDEAKDRNDGPCEHPSLFARQLSNHFTPILKTFSHRSRPVEKKHRDLPRKLLPLHEFGQRRAKPSSQTRKEDWCVTQFLRRVRQFHRTRHAAEVNEIDLYQAIPSTAHAPAICNHAPMRCRFCPESHAGRILGISAWIWPRLAA